MSDNPHMLLSDFWRAPGRVSRAPFVLLACSAGYLLLAFSWLAVFSRQAACVLLACFLWHFWHASGAPWHSSGMRLKCSWRASCVLLAALRAVREGPWATYGLADMRNICGIHAEYMRNIRLTFCCVLPPGVLQLGCVPPH